MPPRYSVATPLRRTNLQKDHRVLLNKVFSLTHLDDQTAYQLAHNLVPLKVHA